MRHARHVLLSTTYYWPEPTGNAPYVTALAEHLVRQGHEVSVIAGFPHYPDWKPAGRRLAARERRNGVNITRRWHYVPRQPTAVHRGLYEASLVTVGATALVSRASFDAVVAVVPTLAAGLLALAAARRQRVPLGLVFQDLVGLAATQNGIRGWGFATHLSRIELKLAQSAAAVGVIAPGFESHLVQGGVRDERIRLLPNWSHAHEATETPGRTRERLGWLPDEFVCLHAGNMGQKQGLDNLLDAARVLNEGDGAGRPIRIVLAGDGNDRARLETRARALRLRNVSFVAIQPSGQYEAMLAAADLLIAHQRPTLTNAALPSKLTSYFRAGRPVLAVASPESETARVVCEAGAGIAIDAGDPGALASTLAAAAAGELCLDACGRAAQDYAERELSEAAALQRYDQFVGELLEGAA